MPLIAPELSQAPSWVEVPAETWHHDGMNAFALKCAPSPSVLQAALLGGLLFSMAGRAAPDPAAASLPLLPSVRQVREISPAQAAQGYPVRLHGVVTFCNANADVGLFLQDTTAGIYIKLGEGTNVNAGDEVVIEGPTSPGDYVPMVLAQHVNV